MILEIEINGAFASSILRDDIVSSHAEQGSLVWAIAETSASNQEANKGGDRNGPGNDSGTLCVKRMDACYEACKLKEVQPGSCNLSCTTDRICGMPVRLSYGQFLDFQVEMLSANANIFPNATQRSQNANGSAAQLEALPEPKRRSRPNRLPGARTKPGARRPRAVPAETGTAENSGWPHLSWPQFSWPHF
jgi:hypothetical protein